MISGALAILGTAGGFILKAVGLGIIKKVLVNLLEKAIGAFGSEKFIIGIVLKAGERIVKSTDNKLDDYWFADFKRRVEKDLEDGILGNEEEEVKEEIKEEE